MNSTFEYTLDQRLLKNGLKYLEDRSIILTGPSGVGKSFYAKLMGNELKKRGFNVAIFDCYDKISFDSSVKENISNIQDSTEKETNLFEILKNNVRKKYLFVLDDLTDFKVVFDDPKEFIGFKNFRMIITTSDCNSLKNSGINEKVFNQIKQYEIKPFDKEICFKIMDQMLKNKINEEKKNEIFNKLKNKSEEVLPSDLKDYIMLFIIFNEKTTELIMFLSFINGNYISHNFISKILPDFGCIRNDIEELEKFKLIQKFEKENLIGIQMKSAIQKRVQTFFEMKKGNEDLLKKMVHNLSTSMKGSKKGNDIQKEAYEHSIKLKECIYLTNCNKIELLKTIAAYERQVENNYKRSLETEIELMKLKISEYGEMNFRLDSSYNTLAKLFYMNGDPKESILYYKKQLELIKKYETELKNIDLSIIYVAMGSCYSEMGQYDDAIETFEKCIEIKKSKNLKEDNNEFVSIYNNLGTCYSRKGEYIKALEYHNRCLTILEKENKNLLHISFTYNNIGICHQQLGENDKALKSFNESININKQIFDAKHTSLASSYYNIGCVYKKKEEYQAALDSFQKSLEVLKSCCGNEHPQIESINKHISDCKTHISIISDIESKHPPLYFMLGNVCLKKGDFKRAHKNYIKNLELTMQNLKDPNKDEFLKHFLKFIDDGMLILKECNKFKNLMNNKLKPLFKVQCYFLSLQNISEAFDNYKNREILLKNNSLVRDSNVTSILLTIKKEIEFFLIEIFNEFAMCNKEINCYDQAIKYFNKSLELWEKRNYEPVKFFTSFEGLAFCLRLQEKYAQAVDSYKKMLKILERKETIPNAEKLATIYYFIAVCYKSLGDKNNEEIYMKIFTKMTEELKQKREEPSSLTNLLFSLGKNNLFLEDTLTPALNVQLSIEISETL